MEPQRLTTSMARPLLPNWASIAITFLAVIAVASLVWHLEEQNRLLREALIPGAGAVASTRTPVVGDRLPAIDLVQLDGTTATVASLVPTGGVVAFLTTTCPFCEASLSQWGEIAANLGDAGMPFVAISLDELEKTRLYAVDHGIIWPVWAAADFPRTRELRVNSVPVTAILSPNAEIIQIWRGQLRSDDVEDILRAARETRGS